MATALENSEPAPRPSFLQIIGRNRRFRRSLWIFLIVVLLAVAGRLTLPIGLKWAVNRRLNEIPDYQGSVDDVHVALWRGAYALKGLRIVKRTARGSVPFATGRTIDFSLAWRDLIHG